jgi:DNA-binding CsgD family transcriptional regulator
MPDETPKPPPDEAKEHAALLKLSPIERRVFDCWVKGAGSSETGTAIHMRQPGVTAYRRKVLDKLALTNTVDVVLFAVRQGLIDSNLCHY